MNRVWPLFGFDELACDAGLATVPKPLETGASDETMVCQQIALLVSWLNGGRFCGYAAMVLCGSPETQLPFISVKGSSGIK